MYDMPASDYILSLLFAYLSQCSSFVDTYASAIVQLLLDRVSPQEICTHIKLCSATPAIEVPEGTVCAACEWVMSMVENFLLEDRTQTQIIQFLSNVCYSHLCGYLVSNFIGLPSAAIVTLSTVLCVA